ncbi:amino acid adenylation domain-containing protein, partial [Chitinophaga niastensis]
MENILAPQTLVEIIIKQKDIKDKGITFIGAANKGDFLSYHQLYLTALSWLKYLQDKGLKPGDELVFQIEDSQTFIELFWACILGAIIPVPVAMAHHGENVQKLFNIKTFLNNPTLFISRAQYKKLRAMIHSDTATDKLIFDKILFVEEAKEHTGVGIIHPVTPDAIAFLQFSSGSTGNPKGVVLTHHNLITNIYAATSAHQCGEQDSYLSWMPLTHDMGLIGFHLFPIGAGVNQYLIPTDLFIRNPLLWMQKVSEYRATITCSPNFGYKYYLNQFTEEKGKGLDLSSVKIILNGAEPVSASLCRTFIDTLGKFHLHPRTMCAGYGLAEASLEVTFAGIHMPLRTIMLRRDAMTIGCAIPEEAIQGNSTDYAEVVNLGYVIDGVTVKITDEKEKELKDGHIGIIWIKGDAVTSSYYNNETATKAVIKKDGWLNTGDTGFMRGGCLHVIGRVKDIIFVNGANVYPHDVEQTLEQLDGIETGKVVVCGVPDEETGSEGIAVFVLYKSSVQKFQPVITEIKRFIAAKFGLEVKHVLPVRKIHKTTSGKVKRFFFVEEYRKGTYNEVILEIAELNNMVISKNGPVLSDKDNATGFHNAEVIRQWLQQWLQQRLHLTVADLDTQHTFASYGMTSLLAVTLAVDLEAWLQVTIDNTAVYNFPTIDTLAAHLSGISTDSSRKKQHIVSQVTDNRIAVIGIGCRFPGGISTPAAFWKLLREQRSAITVIPQDRWNVDDYFSPDMDAPGKMYTRYGGFIEQVDQFDPSFFGVSPKEADWMDPQQRLLLEVCWEALENAKLRPSDLRGSNSGVFIGVGTDDYQHLVHNSVDVSQLENAFNILGIERSIAAGRIAYMLDFHGPVVQLDTACSSSLLSVHQACQNILLGECSLALAGGVNLMLSPDTTIRLCRMKALSPSGLCKTFDDNADGYVRGEGCGVVVLKRFSDALADGDNILATITGSAANHDGLSNGLTAPNGIAQQHVIEKALANAGISADKVQYVEAHGTGTPLGDPVEVLALNNVYGRLHTAEQRLLIGAVKTNIGHLEAAAGIAGFIKTVLCLQHQQIPASLHYQHPNHFIPWNDMMIKVADQLTEWQPSTEKRMAAVSAFGLSGTNVHVILEEGIIDKNRAGIEARTLPSYPLLLSAKTPAALQATAEQYIALAVQSTTALEDIAYSSIITRDVFEYRLAVEVTSRHDIYQYLHAFINNTDDSRVLKGSLSAPKGKLVWLFTGQGAQYWKMGQELYENSLVFRGVMDHCDAFLEKCWGFSLTTLLYEKDKEEGNALLNQTAFAQPALFAISCALAALWQSWGIYPDIVAGHSVGEYAAAYVAGVFSLDDGLRLVTERGRLMQALDTPGAMSIVYAPVALVAEVIHPHAGELSIAAVNAPELTVVSGNKNTLNNVLSALGKSGVKSRKLVVSHAFHSPLMQPVLEEFSEIAASIRYQQPSIDFVSNVTGKVVTTEIANGDYWCRHIMSPVYFSESIKAIKQLNGEVLMELGPQPHLLSMAQLTWAIEDDNLFPAMQQGKSSWSTMLQSIMKLHVKGIAVNWENFYADHTHCKVPLPNYPFQRQHYWITAGNRVPYRPALPGKETVIPDNIGDSTLATKNSRTVILTYLSNLLGKSLKIPPAEINIHADFMLLGTDSLILSSMIRSVEKEYKIKLSVRQLFDQLITLDLLAGYIEANVPPGFFAETAPQASESPDSELTAVKAIEALSASIQNQFLALQQQLVDMLGQQFQLLSGQLKAGHVIKDNQEVSLPDQPIVQRNSQPVKPLHIPLSFNQESLWFIDQLYGGSIQYNVPMVLRLDGSLDPTALSFALQNIVHRHEVLRTVIRQEEDLAYQFVLDKDHWQLITIDNDLLKEDPQELKAYISTLIHTPFDLSEDYMLRAHLIRLSEAAHILVVMTHHIASDGWSAEIILREMVELYTAFVEKRPAQTPPLPMQYSDYALRQRAYLSEERLSEAIAYWKNQLAGVTTLQLPTDYTRPAVQGLSGADKRFRLDQELSDQLMVLSREQGTTLFMTLLTTFKVLLYHYSGQEDICVGSPMAGRMEEEVEGLVGFFVNTLVLRSDLGNNPSFTSLLQQVKQTTLAAYEHQEAPFEKVVEAVVKNRMQDRNPLYQVVFRAEKRPDISAFSLGSVQLSREIIDYTVAKFDMVFVVSEGAEGINVIVEYRKDLFKEDTIARFCGHFEQLLSAVTTAPETKIGALKILTEQERYQLLEDFAPARLSFSSTNKTILDLFEEQVSHSPDNIAVMFEGTKLTYRELDGRSNQLARHLVRLGVKPDCPVPICMERSADLITGILGIMKAGGAYVPVDPDYPAVRIAWVLEDTIATVVVSTTASASKIPGGNGFVKVLIDEDWPVISQEKDSNFTGIATADHLAYIIYTSGSTGNPKGVMITHRNLIDYLSGLKEYLDIAACRSFALVSGVSTDLGNTVIYSSLSAGGALHLFSKTTVNDINLLQQYFIREQIDCLKIVPSHWKALAADEKLLIPARLLIFGGDVLPAYFISLIRKNGGTCKIVNHYGPTETTIGKLMYEVTDDSIHETGIIPLGRPFSNTQVYILNHNMELCPVGVAGELYISGDGLARGYWNNQLLTEQKFITHSFDGINKTRLYRTGDLVKYLPDGNIVFISRIDTQVKLRGYRIEMGEIEDVLRRCGFVSQAVVMIKGEEENRKLVGYVVAEGNFDREGIYAHLKERLPEYMLPTQIVELENFPLTSNGKIDRKALPDPDISVQHTRTYVAPRNIVEKALADIWEELLETQEVGIHDDFFELGGHSLLAIRLISAIRKKLGIEITIGDIFDYPTISSLMARIGLHVDKNTAPAIMPGNRPAIIPLSFSQERLWFIDQMEGSTQYHTLVTFRLKGNLNREGLAHALQTIVNRHEVLRTVIEEKDGIAFQRVLEKDHWQLILKDDTIYKKDKKALQSYVQSLITIPFDLSADHMLRAYLFLLDEKEYLLAFTMHHIASDGWSISIIIRELVELYNATVEGRIAKLPVLPLQYADYAVWQRTNMQGDVLDKKISYWKDKLSGVASLHLPVDYTRPAVQSTRGADRKFFLDQELSAQLHTLSHQQGTTLFMTLLTAFNVLVHRYSGEDDICVGSPIAGRTLQEIEGLIGFFVNTLALRSDLKDDPTFISLLHQVKHTTLEAYEHQDVPFEKVVEVVVKERDLSKTPLFQVIFELHNTPDVPELRLNNLHLIREETGQVSTLSDLIFSIRESTGGLSGNVIFCTDLFRLETIDRMIIHFEQLLRAIVKAPNDRISTFNMLAPAEVQQLLVDFNNTVVTNTKQANETLISLFVAQAARTPDAIALKFEEQQLTYETLDKRSNQLAHYLCSKGITAETLVPVCLERSPEMIIGILGILKAGGAYVPIDPDYPEERIGFILEDTGALIVLSSSACLASVPLTIPIVILLDKDWEIIDNYPSMAPKVSLTATQLAYVIYTSGSTGTPKGVLIEHSSVVNLVLSQRNALRLKEGTSSLQFASLGFDASCYEIFNTLMSGGVLVLPGKEDLLSEESFGAFVEKHRVEVVTLPPSYLHIIKNVLGPVTTVVSAGEALNREDARYIMSKSIRLVNAYGPTENTVCTSLTDQPLRENNVVVIGTPIENVQIYICNIHGNLCPIGVVGEICVGGAGVARGYLDRTELTAEKFVPDPYRKEWGGRLYKTGDLGRWLPDGNIEYLGRMDDQVKIRGFRIELGEIETVLQACALVRQAVVLIQTDSTGDKQLVGYIVPSGTFNRDGIFDYLKEKLPEYMIPSLLSELEELPLTANGKIDKKALSEPDASSMLTSGYVAPRNMIEQTLVTIWEELLGLQRVGINDNFFRSGGHSLLAIRFVSMLRSKLQIEIAVNLLFQYATIASLAVYLKERERGLLLPGIEAVTRPLNIPLSYSQERLWFIDQLEGSVQYHISAAFKLMGISHINVLEDCLQTIINRHEVLRTVITQEQGQAYQRVQEKDLWKLMIVDDITLETDPNALQTYISNLIFTPFDLSKDHMIRVHLIRFSENEHIMVITIHHIVGDAWTLPILIKEIMELYAAGVEGRSATLAPLPIQYADYAIWQRAYLSGQVLNKQLAYWEEKLAGLEPLNLPTDYMRPAIQSIRGAKKSFRLSRDLCNQWQIFADEQNATLFMTLLAAFKVLLYRYSGQEDICVGTSIAGRTHEETEGLIGFFVNTLALRSDLSNAPSFITLLQQVKQTTLYAYEYQDVPFEKVVEVVEKERDMSRTSLFQVMFELFNTPKASELKLGELHLSKLPIEHITTLFDLSFCFEEDEDGLNGYVEYCIDLFSADTITRMIAHYEQLLWSILRSPEIPVSSLSMFSAQEKEQLLIAFNDTVVDYPRSNTFIDLFQAQAARTPDAVAVVFEDTCITYKELDNRSNQMSRYFSSKGVKAESLVPVCLQRSLDMIIAIMGIMKAGGAYVPIDPAYPAERIIYILEDCNASILVTNSELKQKMPVWAGIEILVAESNTVMTADLPVTPLPATISPDNLAYVIYTSGSTGQPKGAMIEHGGMLNHLFAKINDLKVNDSTILAYTASYTFDISIWQMFASLLCGGHCIIYGTDLITDPLNLIREIDKDQVTILELVPSYLAAVLQEEPEVTLRSLEYLLVTGEVIHQPLLAQWFRHPAYGSIPVVNAYGPTEASDDICHYFMYETPARTNIPLGKPIQNLNIYILDNSQRLCPVGVAGEICVSGVGVGRGYLNRPGLTAEKFIEDPYNTVSSTRMYRTGDLGRWLPDGNIECLGRIDDQVKVRGYRIELGEIESALQQSELVNQAVVLVKAEANTKRLLSYYVPDHQAVKLREQELYLQQAENWQELWETEYNRTVEEGTSQEEFNLTGWNDTFTGKAIPEDDMRKWLDDIVNVILSEKPERVLEIGCGAGLIYYQLAGHIKKYIGTDFSSVSVSQIRNRISQGEKEYPHTILRVAAAHEVTLDEDEVVDLVILNSVIQYFPGEQYLTGVLEKSISCLKNGGRIVIGDVRDNRLLKSLKSRLSIDKFQERAGKREFVWGVDMQLLKEEELCFSPEYFYNLKNRYPEITHVDIQLKKGDYVNELTLYRYTVVIYVGVVKPVMTPSWQPWNLLTDLQKTMVQLNNGAPVVALQDVPNTRLWKEIQLEHGLKDSAIITVGDLSKYIENPDSNMVAMNELLLLAQDKGYHCRFLLDEDPLKINLLLEQAPFPGFISSVYGNNDDLRTATTNIPLYGDICELLEQDIRNNLLKQLPEYMVPSEFVPLHYLPLTANGKIDRKFLNHREDIHRKSVINYQAPVTAMEIQLANIWQVLLGTDRIGIHDNFFESGGHSLLATRVVSAIRKELKVELTVKDFFLYPTITLLAAYIRKTDKGLLLPAIETGPRPLNIPLSYSQERLWFIDQLEGSMQYHIPAILKLKGRLNIAALTNALQTIINRHEVLRTVIIAEDGIAYQQVKNKDEWELMIADDLSYREDQGALQSYIQSLIATPFDLSADHMLRAHLIVLDKDEYVLIVIMHHIASDGWSANIIVKELVELYSAFIEARQAELPALSVQYSDYAIWQRTYLSADILTKKLDYWKHTLKDVSTLQLPLDYTRTPGQRTNGAGIRLVLDKELYEQLRLLGHQQHTTLFMTLLAAFKVLLYRYCNQTDICVGTSTAVRQPQEVENLVGFFVNTLALRSDVSNHPSFISLLQQVKATTLNAYEHEDVPFEKVVEAIVKNRDPGKSPLFQVMFAMQHAADAPELHLGELVLSKEIVDIQTAKFDITFFLVENKNGLQIEIVYGSDLFREETIVRMADHYVQLLRSAVKEPSQQIDLLPMLTQDEEQELLTLFDSKVGAGLPDTDHTIIDLLASQAAQTPNAIALVFEDSVLTYGELDERSSQL